jgi:GNAT superfamily N-acetyltransferase
MFAPDPLSSARRHMHLVTRIDRPMKSARDFRVEHALRSGTPVTIRAVRTDDRERVASAFAQLDRESVYTRFFAYKSALSALELGRIDTMDFVRDVMLVATTGSDKGEIVIGSGRYVACDAADGIAAAEVAFIVEEDYQGLGVATRLLSHLVSIARRCGFERFEADVLSGNKAMLGVFARTGLPLKQRREGGVIHVTIDLAKKETS